MVSNFLAMSCIMKKQKFFDLDIKDHTEKDFVEIKIIKEFEEQSDSFPEAVVNKKFISNY